MGVLRAQEFELMGREIHDQNTSTRSEDSNGFAQCRLRIVQEVQHLMKKDGIEAACGLTVAKGEAINVTTTDLAIESAGPSQPVARNRKHFRTDIDADAALDVRREQLKHSPRAGARVQHRIEAVTPEQAHNRRFHIMLGHMQRANPLPLRCRGTEIGGRLLRPQRAHFRETSPVVHENGIVLDILGSPPCEAIPPHPDPSPATARAEAS